MSVILAIDGGGTHTRCVAISLTGEVIGVGSGGASNHLLVDKTLVRSSLDDAIGKALSKAGMRTSEVECVSAGLAGVDFDGTGAYEMEEVFREFGFAKILVSGDMVTAHAGALGGRSGVLALAGTGSSVLGIGEDGTRVKVGGWGPIFGDEGSGYRIGAAALRAVARDFDGRGPRTELTRVIVNELRIRDFKDSIEAVYLDEMQPSEIAKLSKAVYGVAKAGDEIAMDILRTAGKELSECVTAAIRRMGSANGNIRVSYQGSVITSCEFMRESFCRELSDASPAASIIPPRFPPVVGAYLLGRTELGLNNDERLFSKLDECHK